MIKKLGENQLALTEGLKKNRLAITGLMDEVKKWDLKQLPDYEEIEYDDDDDEYEDDGYKTPMEEDEEVTLRIPQREKPKKSVATFYDEDFDKNLKYKAAEDYLDKIGFPYPSSLKGVTSFKTIEETVLEPAEKKNH